MKSQFLVRYEPGFYSYKNGISIKREGKFWKVYNAMREPIFMARTLRRCVEYAAAPADRKSRMRKGKIKK